MIRNKFNLQIVFVFCALTLDVFAHATEVTAEEMIKQLAPPLTRNFSIKPAGGKLPSDAVSQNDSTGGAGTPSLSLMVNFEFGSSKIRTDSKPMLNQLAKALVSERLQNSKFILEGHTDATGNPKANQNLSLVRARAVRDYLGANGVEPTRLLAVGKGSSELANTSNPSAAENRRVRIVNIN